MNKKLLIMYILFIAIFITGCKKENLLETYYKIIEASDSVENYTYTEKTSYGESKLEMDRIVWVSENEVKSTLKYKENPEDELTTYINLEENKTYLYYKTLKTAMVKPVEDRTLQNFILPFSKKSNLGDVSKDEIKSIEKEKIGDLECDRVQIVWKEGDEEFDLSIWYDNSSHLPIKYELAQNGNILKSNSYENVKSINFDKEIFKLPEDTVIQGLGISK